MSKRWSIESRAGVVHGTYDGASEKEAFMAMLAESGDAGSYGEAHVGTEADWIIKPVGSAPAAPQFQSTERPRYCPWGQIDDAKQVAPGIWSVVTPGHGGYLLSLERWAAMPAYLRINNSTSNRLAFEEDCEWALVVMAFPHEFPETTRYNAGRVISATSRFSFPGFDADPWKKILEKHPPLKLTDLTRESRIALVRYRNWNDMLTEAEATALVDANEDLKEERV